MVTMHALEWTVMAISPIIISYVIYALGQMV